MILPRQVYRTLFIPPQSQMFVLDLSLPCPFYFWFVHGGSFPCASERKKNGKKNKVSLPKQALRVSQPTLGKPGLSLESPASCHLLPGEVNRQSVWPHSSDGSQAPVAAPVRHPHRHSALHRDTQPVLPRTARRSIRVGSQKQYILKNNKSLCLYQTVKQSHHNSHGISGTHWHF